MKPKIDDEYFEILIQPQDFIEIFADFISSNIQEMLEEISSPYDFKGHQNDLTPYDLSVFFPQEEQKYSQLIIRTTQSPQSILDLLIEFSDVLSKRVGERVEFGFGYKVCQNKDWIEAYKQSILPISVGGFYIRPSWHKSAKELGLSLDDVVIDPALAFGSGHHATTSMCLEFLSQMDLKDKRLLDVGCGSGILSICSSRLGANVEICDTDEFAIEESGKNFALNNEKFVKSWVGSITQAQGEYDVIVANILAHIIIMLHYGLKEHLKVGGTLILSGILQTYQDEVLEKFKDFEVVQISQKDEWVALKLAKLK